MNKNWRKAIYESTPLKTIFKKYRSRDAGTTTNKKKKKKSLYKSNKEKYERPF